MKPLLVRIVFVIILGIVPIVVFFQNCGSFKAQDTQGSFSSTTRVVSTSIEAANQYLDHKLVVAGSTSCLINLDSTVSCRGSNIEGLFNDGTRSGSKLPIKVPNVDNAVSIFKLKRDHGICVSLRDQSLKCWGSFDSFLNSTKNVVSLASTFLTNQVYALLDDGSVVSKAGAVIELSESVQLVGGGNRLCALSRYGSVKCAFAAGTGSNQEPFPVAMNSDVKTIAIGQSLGNLPELCAVFKDGTVKCEGLFARYNISGLNGKALSVVMKSDDSGCVLIEDGTVQCFGKVLASRMKLSTPATDTSAFTIGGISEAIQLSADSDQKAYCALLRSGERKCWDVGYTPAFGFENYEINNQNYSGVSSLSSYFCGLDNTKIVHCVPSLAALDFSAVGAVKEINDSCFITLANEIKCWNSDTALAPTGPVITTYTPSALPLNFVGARCVLLQTGNVECYPAGSATVLLPGTPIRNHSNLANLCFAYSSGNSFCYDFTNYLSRNPVFNGLPLSAATQVALWKGGGCALDNAATMRCWGTNNYGQLGNGTFVNSATAEVVPGLIGNVRAIGAGDNGAGVFVCALLTSAELKCWGANNNGQLGEFYRSGVSSPTHVDVAPQEIVTDFQLSKQGGCYRGEDSMFSCWGADIKSSAHSGVFSF